MSISDNLLEYYREGKIRFDMYLRNVTDKQLLVNYLQSMDLLISNQKQKIMDNPQDVGLKRGLEHMNYVREKVWVRHNQINKGGLYQ